jgi:hypothetical protein
MLREVPHNARDGSENTVVEVGRMVWCGRGGEVEIEGDADVEEEDEEEEVRLPSATSCAFGRLPLTSTG